MYANQDIIRIEALAVVLDKSRESVLRDLHAGRVPPRDVHQDKKTSGLETVHAEGVEPSCWAPSRHAAYRPTVTAA